MSINTFMFILITPTRMKKCFLKKHELKGLTIVTLFLIAIIQNPEKFFKNIDLIKISVYFSFFSFKTASLLMPDEKRVE